MSDRVVHRGGWVNSKGQVSALCFKRPRAIDMKRATWVGHDDAVTCPKCVAVIAARSPAPAPEPPAPDPAMVAALGRGFAKEVAEMQAEAELPDGVGSE